MFIDTNHAVPSNGEAGLELEAGPRIGRDTLEAILCDAVTEITIQTEHGVPMAYGRHSRTISPALRRAIIHRDHNRCAADGCNSRTGSKSTTSPPGAKAGQQTRTI